MLGENCCTNDRGVLFMSAGQTHHFVTTPSACNRAPRGLRGPGSIISSALCLLSQLVGASAVSRRIVTSESFLISSSLLISSYILAFLASYSFSPMKKMNKDTFIYIFIRITICGVRLPFRANYLNLTNGSIN